MLWGGREDVQYFFLNSLDLSWECGLIEAKDNIGEKMMVKRKALLVATMAFVFLAGGGMAMAQDWTLPPLPDPLPELPDLTDPAVQDAIHAAIDAAIAAADGDIIENGEAALDAAIDELTGVIDQGWLDYASSVFGSIPR